MTLIFLGFSLIVLVLTVFKGFWAYVLLLIIFIGSFAFGRLKKGIVIVILTLMVLISMFWHQQKIKKFNINSALFSGKIINQEGEARYVAEVDTNKVLLRDDQTLIPTHYEGGFLGGGYFKRSSPWGVVFFDFWKEADRYSHWLFMKGFWWAIYLNSFLPVQVLPDDKRTPFLRALLSKSQKTLSQRIDLLYSQPYRWILKAILLWDREDLGYRQYRQLIDTGLVHIVVISGAHLGLIAWALGLLLIWVPFYLRLILIFLWMSFYMLMVGADPSILRAWLLMSLYLLSLGFGKEVLIWRMLGAVWIIMLIYNPRFLLYDVGFALSFAAVAGIVLAFNILKEFVKNSYFQKLMASILIPIGAFWGILPILLFFIWEVNVLSWFLNILILPLLPLIMISAVFSLIVPQSDFIVKIMIDILLAVNQWGLEHGIWLQTPQHGWRAMGLLLLSMLWLYAAYLFFWKFLPSYRYEQLYQGSQRHKSITDQIEL